MKKRKRSGSARSARKRNHILNNVAKPVVVNEPPFGKKLEQLIQLEPKNSFYESLRQQMRKGHPLSPKQLQAINDDYGLKVAK